MPDSITVFRWAFRVLALVCTAGSATLTWKFGLAQSTDPEIAIAVAGVLCCFSFASDYVWLFVKEAWRQRQIGTFVACVAGGLVVLGLNLASNLGSVGWQNDVVTADALRRNANHAVAEKAATMSSDKRRMLEGLLAQIRTEHPWAATTTAEALRSQIALKKADAAREAANVKCGTACRALEREALELERQRGIVEQREDYESQIAALERALKAETATVVETNNEREVAAPVAQAVLFASFALGTLTPSMEAQTWSQRLVATAIAIGLVVGPVLFGLIGFSMTPGAGATVARAPVTGLTTTSAAPLVPIRPAPATGGRTTIVQHRFSDARFAKAAATLLAPYNRQPRALAA